MATKEEKQGPLQNNPSVLTTDQKKNLKKAESKEGQDDLAKSGKGKFSNLREKVKMISTDKDKFHKTGEVFEIHPNLVESLVKRGLATVKKVKEKEEAEEGAE